MRTKLRPLLSDLSSDIVLIQAWKKTVSYLRSFNWYADTFEIDYQSLRLPDFIADLQHRLKDYKNWTPRNIDLIPAPKNQTWEINDGNWTPIDKVKIRPLAHIDLQDQVIATAIMMCLADRVENLLGNVDDTLETQINAGVVAYGHRLFCDIDTDKLKHNWGSNKTYRGYYSDYKNYLERPTRIEKKYNLAPLIPFNTVVTIKSDIECFYDSITHDLLSSKLKKLKKSKSESSFFNLACKVLCWEWNDKERATSYAKENLTHSFQKVALPQGLVSAGFFSNIVLIDFFIRLRESNNSEIISSRLTLKDACIYVDDITLTCLCSNQIDVDIEKMRNKSQRFLQNILDSTAPGLMISDEKTIAIFNDEQQTQREIVIRQSREANRIQHMTSGVLDPFSGTNVLGIIEGFFNLQQKTSKTVGLVSPFLGKSDMKDETVARFSANQFKRTFRTLRPLLHSENKYEETSEERDYIPNPTLTKQQIDEKAKVFSAQLIEEWLKNPSNIRLVRIALDIYPDSNYLDQVLCYLDQNADDKEQTSEIKFFCLADLFRAAATDLAQVDLSDQDLYPSSIDIHEFHTTLTEKALEVLSSNELAVTPWYLLQQLLLYLLKEGKELPIEKIINDRNLLRYKQYIKYLTTNRGNLQNKSIFYILKHSTFNLPLKLLPSREISPKLFKEIYIKSPPFAKFLCSSEMFLKNNELLTMAKKLDLTPNPQRLDITQYCHSKENFFHHEINILKIAQFLFSQPKKTYSEVVSPDQIFLDQKVTSSIIELQQTFPIEKLQIKDIKSNLSKLFEIPSWCKNLKQKKLYNIGLILRYLVNGSICYSSTQQKLGSYTQPSVHWSLIKFPTYNGRKQFGPDWLPISSFVEDLLYKLLDWPGSKKANSSKITQISKAISNRVKKLDSNYGTHSKLPFLEQLATLPPKLKKLQKSRELRVGIVQTITPSDQDYIDNPNDLTFSTPENRARTRRHLSSVLLAFEQMLRVRETHKTQTKGVDLVIFPELSIHPEDLRLLLLPFIRQHKCIVLCGNIFHSKSPIDSTLINSAHWLIPTWSPDGSFDIKQIEQGKENLTQTEIDANIESFRPAQWIINYEWHPEKRPLKLSASVCYDSTDLSLATDLKTRSDLYIIPALNVDVTTFDKMAEALNYHMYQGVILVNNGQYGGSNFHMPYKNVFKRKVFHVHGQPQVTIAFAEVDPLKLIERPVTQQKDGLEVHEDKEPQGKWKTPPANYRGPLNS